MTAHQLDIYDCIARAPRFDGSDVTDADVPRLTGQLLRVYEYLADGRWRTLAAISAATGAPEASASAQCRNLKKARFGSHTVERRHLGHGLYEYRLALPEPP